MKYLIVIDMQNDFINMALGTLEAESIVSTVKEKIESYKKQGYNIIFTRDTHQSNYLDTNEGKYLPVPHCIENTLGWEINSELDTNGGVIINKESFGFLGWKDYIKDDKNLELELVGLCTDICVVSNALILKATFPNATIKVDSKATAGVTPKTHNEALETMKMCQIEVV